MMQKYEKCYNKMQDSLKFKEKKKEKLRIEPRPGFDE
jgi:hypothetical protein